MKFIRKHENGVIAIILSILAAIILISTAQDIGVIWDERAYTQSADSYGVWLSILGKDPLRALQPATLDTYWHLAPGHPAVERLWSGLIWLATRHSLNFVSANRLGPILLACLLVALLYLMIAETYGKPAGLFASAALMSMPRFFFHAHVEALDVPVAFGTFALTFVIWKTVDRKSWSWAILWGVVWGLAAGIKINGVFVPIALAVWIFIFRRKWSQILRLFVMGLVAVPTFILAWPWLYQQTWTRIVIYANVFLQHSPHGQWYLGRFYLPPPWTFVFVMIWAVVPLTVMALFLAGITRAGKGKRDGGLTWLLIISAFICIFPFLFGKTVIYDDERSFMPVFPFIAALAGIGFSWLVRSLEKLLIRAKRPALYVPASFLIGIALLAPQAISMAGLYPHLLSYYSEGVGGLPGATKLGLETTYWCETCASAIPYLNAHAKPGDVILMEGSYVYLYYQEAGLLRKDVSMKEMHGYMQKADWYIFEFRQSQYGPGGPQNYSPLQILQTQTPVFEVNYQGVPMLNVYGAIK